VLHSLFLSHIVRCPEDDVRSVLGVAECAYPLFASYVIPGLEDDEPDEESSGYDRQDTSSDLETPRVGQVVCIGVASQPEILALQPERIVSEDHHHDHDKHACYNEEYGYRVDETSFTTIPVVVATAPLTAPPDQ